MDFQRRPRANILIKGTEFCSESAAIFIADLVRHSHFKAPVTHKISCFDFNRLRGFRVAQLRQTASASTAERADGPKRTRVRRIGFNHAGSDFALVALLVVVDPVGLCRPSSASPMAYQKFRRQTHCALAIAGAILTGTALFSDWLLRNLDHNAGFGSPAACCYSSWPSRWCWACASSAAQDAEQAAENTCTTPAFPLAIPMMADRARSSPFCRQPDNYRPMACGAACRCMAATQRVSSALPLPSRSAKFWRHRQRGDMAAARRDPRGAGRTVCDRRRARRVRFVVSKAG